LALSRSVRAVEIEEDFMRNITVRRWCFAGPALLFAAHMAHAQGILGTNLIVNGNAELGTAGTATTAVTSIPGWTKSSGSANVLPYTITGFLVQGNPAPLDHGFQYFAGAPSDRTSTLTQNIDVSSGASTINGGNIKYTASAYLGSAKGSGLAPAAQMAVAFKNGNGQTFSTATVGPQGFNGNGISLQQQIGLVPAGTVTVTVTLTLNMQCENAAQCAYAAADSLSLVFSQLGTTPSAVLGANLIANSGAEGATGVTPLSTAPYVPGWSTSSGASVAPYGGTGWISTSDSGPVNRGVNLFCGPGSSYQDLDVSPAAALIDAGQVTYDISAWLGSIAGTNGTTLTYRFFDWSGAQLAPTATLGPASHSGTGMAQVSNSGTLPVGVRRVRVSLTFPANTALADNINFTLAAPPGAPVILPGGLVSASAFGGFTSIAPGSWIEIYGFDLASATQSWAGSDFVNGVAPTSLGGVSVSIGGKAAFIDYVSTGQIDAQVPSGTPTGAVPVTVTTANGTSDQYYLNVNPTEPGLLAPASFVIGGKQYVAALFSDGQTFALPSGAIPGVASRPAVPGDVLTIYGVGFGPVTNGFTAGTIVTGQNSLTAAMQFSFGTAAAMPAYDGLAPSFVGLYQFNVVVPAVAANNALPFSFTLGGTKGTQMLYIAVQN
jgi:uncharacterized protein (TIGR03437 family)